VVYEVKNIKKEGKQQFSLTMPEEMCRRYNLSGNDKSVLVMQACLLRKLCSNSQVQIVFITL